MLLLLPLLLKSNTYIVLKWKYLSYYKLNEKGFSFIAVEGDWPDCYKVNRYIKGFPDSGKNAYDVLYSFNRWSTWMWANKEMIELVEWLKLYNDKKQLQEQKTNSFTSNFNSNGNGKKDWWILWSGSL